MAKRLNRIADSDLKSHDYMDYEFIPTTVFSKTEYSFVGLSEEEAVKKYG
jgi:pyruvate/2-oxoglutarate dehydrogenase complex dihydrolipoamide dehydrogenase (E3) component